MNNFGKLVFAHAFFPDPKNKFHAGDVHMNEGAYESWSAEPALVEVIIAPLWKNFK